MTSKELKRIREKLGLTHGELAKHLKVGRTTVLLWEHGRMPKYPPTIDHLERVLHDLEAKHKLA